MELLWFVVGFFVGGSVGTILMAAACAAGRSDYSNSRPQQLWTGAFEGTEILKRVVDDDEEYNHMYSV